MPWMKRGTEIRWVPEHATMMMISSGWTYSDRRAPLSGSEEGPDHLTSNLFERTRQLNRGDISDDGTKTVIPPGEWGMFAFQSGLNTPALVANKWFKENFNAANEYRLASWKPIGHENGAPVWEATWVGNNPGPSTSRGFISGSNLFGRDVKRVRFKLPQSDEPDRDPQEQLNSFLAEQENNLADFLRFSTQGGVSKKEAEAYQNRILDFARLGNFPRSMIDAGFPMADPSQVATEIANVLRNERLGDMDRRKKLADMVLGEIETSAFGIEKMQGAPGTGAGENPAAEDAEQKANSTIAEILAGLLGGRGGGGGQRPVYQPPDRREVEENVRNYLGMVMPSHFDDTLVKRLTERYMTDHRRLFDNPESGLRPWFSVKEEVHKLKEYNQIHALRPDSIPEEEWATRYMIAIENAGIPEGMRDRTAANFATMGATVPAASQGAFRMREHQTGRPQPVFLQNMRNAARVLANKF